VCLFLFEKHNAAAFGFAEQPFYQLRIAVLMNFVFQVIRKWQF
jgi:hypothetical protein